MPDAVSAIASVRDGVCALLRVGAGDSAGQFQIGIVGTTWCAAPTGAFVTAFHVLNAGAKRDPAHRYYILRAAGNGHLLQHWPVVRFLLEDSARDLALLDAPVPEGITVPAIPITLKPPPDGTSVLTYGCPAPIVVGASVTPQGDLTGINTVLFTHASIGIVAAQYDASPLTDRIFEFSVGWHHGESGGPVIQLEPRLAAIAVMQHYRGIQGPQGAMAGPRRGLALAVIEPALTAVGATVL